MQIPFRLHVHVQIHTHMAQAGKVTDGRAQSTALAHSLARTPGTKASHARAHNIAKSDTGAQAGSSNNAQRLLTAT